MEIITNKTTNEAKIFNVTRDSVEMLNFLRKAVIDFVFTSDSNVLMLDDGTYFEVDESSSEGMRWLFCAMLYNRCINTGEWGDIVDWYET